MLSFPVILYQPIIHHLYQKSIHFFPKPFPFIHLSLSRLRVHYHFTLFQKLFVFPVFIETEKRHQYHIHSQTLYCKSWKFRATFYTHVGSTVHFRFNFSVFVTFIAIFCFHYNYCHIFFIILYVTSVRYGKSYYDNYKYNNNSMYSGKCNAYPSK